MQGAGFLPQYVQRTVVLRWNKIAHPEWKYIRLYFLGTVCHTMCVCVQVFAALEADGNFL